MPSYKLTYFDVRGRGELSRYVFYAAGKDFEDNRVGGESWLELKPSKSMYLCGVFCGQGGGAFVYLKNFFFRKCGTLFMHYIKFMIFTLCFMLLQDHICARMHAFAY